MSEDSTNFCGRRYQNSGFTSDNGKVVLLAEKDLACFHQFLHLPFSHEHRGIGDGLEDIPIPAFHHERKALCEKEVPNKDTRFVAPDGVGGGTSSPQLSFVYNVIMEEGGRMDKLNEARHGDMEISVVAAQF